MSSAGCRRLPAREAVTGIAASSISGLDSRAVAALLKELAKTGSVHRAQEFFDYVLGLGEQHEAARLCDVFTYTAAISICNNDQQVSILTFSMPASDRCSSVLCGTAQHLSYLSHCKGAEKPCMQHGPPREQCLLMGVTRALLCSRAPPSV